MKVRIVAVVIIGLAAIAVFHSTLRAYPPTASHQAPAASPAPSGRSVWDGVYTEAQATRGEALYRLECASCHGDDLAGGEVAPALVGVEFSANWNGLTVGELFERVRVSMPEGNPGKLSRQQNADVLAFVLSVNKFPAGKTELARATELLKQIRIERNKPSRHQ